MPKKGGRKPSARKAQTQAALQSVVRHTTRSQQWAPSSSVGTEPAAAAAEPEPEPELEPAAADQLDAAGNTGSRADEVELICAMFQEELSVPSPEDPYTFSLRLAVPDSAQRLRSWTVAVVLDVSLPAHGYPQATQLRVRCTRCDKRALRSLHRGLSLALTDDHSVADNGPRVCAAAQWLVDNAHRYFNVQEVARNPAPAPAPAAAVALREPSGASDSAEANEEWWEEEEEDDEVQSDGEGGDGGKSVGNGVDLCVCVFASLRPTPVGTAAGTSGGKGTQDDGTEWRDEAGRLRRKRRSTHSSDGGATSTSAPMGKLLAQWVRKKYFVGLLLRGAPAVIVLQTNVAPE
jgi:hypothetical protein